jgi:arylsulfatase A-like enzyme
MAEGLPPPQGARRQGVSAAWPAVGLAVALVATKAAHWTRPGLSLEALQTWGRDLLASSGSDLLFAVGFFLAGETLLFLLRRWVPRAAPWGYRGIVGCGVICVVYAVASVEIFAFLRSPLTYPLLYLAGDMGTMSSSLGTFLTPPVVAAFVGAPILYVAVVSGAGRVLPAGHGLRSGLLTVLGATLVLWTGLQGRRIAEGPWKDRDDRLIAENPHWVLVASYAREIFGGHGVLTERDPFPADYVRDFQMAAKAATRARVPAGSRPKNLILIILESTGTRHLGLYGSRYATTPVLDAESAHALVFDNFYCHVGLSANSMAAITLSLFPYMTWRSYTVEYPDMPGTSLADVLKPRGYRTAFMTSGDISYAGAGDFLKGRGFDEMIDQTTLGCAPQTSWGCEDRYLVDGLLRWIDRDCETPFFVMAWTAQSHHPYEPSPDRPFVDFFRGGPLPPDDYDLGRYLNTLLEVDRQLGRVFRGLRERGMADNTLVAITGDHGEAFGDPHPTWGHGARIYEENVHVPLLLWDPRLYQGRHSVQIGSHVDLGPTLTDVMGIAPSPSWHGRSLFDRLHPPRAYFYAANDDYLLGVREGDWKYIYDASLGRDELYNLKLDPLEQRNTAQAQPDRVRRLRQRLAAWKYSVGREVNRLQNPGATTPSPSAADVNSHP